MRIYYPANIRFPMERANALQIVRTCHALARRGHVVHLAVRGGKGTPEEALAFYGLQPHENLRLHRLPALDTQFSDLLWNRSFDVLALLQAVRLCGPEGIRVVFLRDLGLARIFLKLRKLLGIKVVVEVHQIAHRAQKEALYGQAADPGKLARLEKRERQVYAAADALIPLTPGIAEGSREIGAGGVRTEIVPDAADVDAFAGPEPGGPLTVGYVGQLYPWKGADVLVEALALAPSWRGLIVGGMPQEPADAERLRAKDRSGRVEFRPFVPPREVPAIYRRMHATALSLPDTLMGRLYTSPLKLFEAMAAGCAVVASDLPTIREIVTHERTALLVPPGDPKALAAALERLAAEPSLRRSLAAAAREEVRKYSWDERARRIEALLA